MRILFSTILVFYAYQAAAFDPAGLFNARTLPQPSGDRILYEVSSYDRENRNAYDGFTNAQVLYYDRGGYVVFDEAGPGVLTNLWIPRDTAGQYTGDLRFYFDGESLPRIACTREALFSGRSAWAPYPLAVSDDSGSGGNFLFAPMPFRKRLTIVFTRKPFFYHFFFYRLMSDSGLASFDTSLDYRSLAASLGASPVISGSLLSTVSPVVAPGECREIMKLTGAGTILQLKVQSPYDARTLNRLKIMGFWDGAAAPQLFAPLGELFSCRFQRLPFKSALATVDSQELTLTLPMPFRKGALLFLKNDDPRTSLGVTLLVSHSSSAPADSALPFFTHRNLEHPSLLGHDYSIANITGRGQYAGAFIHVKGARSRSFLEGDERFYADGRSVPDLYGTGLEDYVLGGWYFDRGPFAHPFAGYLGSRPGASDRTSVYRFHVADRIPFKSAFKAGIEKMGHPFEDPEFSSLAFYYRADTAGMVLTDSLIIDDTASERRHGFRANIMTDKRSLASSWAGDTSRTEHLNGNWFGDSVRFQVRLDSANRGVLLRCVTDCFKSGQSISVYADSVYAGHWLISAENPVFRFYDADFPLPESLTRGKDSLLVKLIRRPDIRTAGFNAFRYEVYCFRPDTLSLQSRIGNDACLITPDSSNGTRLFLSWAPPFEGAAPPERLVYRAADPGFIPSVSNLAGVCRDWTFTDEGLAPGHTYHYRSALSPGPGTGLSPVFKVRTPGRLGLEADELLPDLVSASCPVRAEIRFNEDFLHPELPLQARGSDTLYSRWSYLRIDADSTGDSAVFNLDLPAQDTFDLRYSYCTGPAFGRFRIALNDDFTDTLIDAFAFETGVAARALRVPVVLYQGLNRILIRSEGRNGLSGGGTLGLDRFLLSTVSERYAVLPDSLLLRIFGVRPNPFNARVSFRFEIARDGPVSAVILDLSGRVVRTLLDRSLPRRDYGLAWDGRDGSGRAVASGLYLIALRAGGLFRAIPVALAR